MHFRSSVGVQPAFNPGWETSKGFSKSYSPTPHAHWLLIAGRAPSTRPTSLHRYFLRKTYHLRLDRSADCAEAAATPAHNPPQASTSLSLQFLSLTLGFSFLTFTMSSPLFLLSVFFLFCPSLLFLSYFLRKETQDNHWAKNNYRYEYSESFLQYDNILTKDKKISWLLTCLSKGMLQRSSAGFHPEQVLILPGVETGVCRREGNSFWHLTVTLVNVVIQKALPLY